MPSLFRRPSGPDSIAARRWDGRESPVNAGRLRRGGLYLPPVMLLLCGALAFLPGAARAQGASPLGVWATAGGKSHIQVYRCGSFLCGKIVWLKQPNGKDGKPARDRHNPDPGKRSQPIVGLRIISGLKPGASATEWKDGTVYDPENGKSYGVQITLSGAGKLAVRGYEGLPMLGETKTWTRVK